MPISKAWLIPSLLLLTACGDGFGVTRAAPQQIMLSDGTVIAGADGWCVDQSTSRSDGQTSVIVLGSCAALARDEDAPRPDVPGIVTVSIETQPGVTPTAEELEAFFASDAGRSALARDGQAASVEILDTQIEDDILFLRSRDTSTIVGTDKQTWRAIFMLNGRIASVSLYGRDDRPITPEDGFQAISLQAQELRSANQG